MGFDRASDARGLLDGLREGFHYSVLQRTEVDEERVPIEVVWNHANEPGVPPRRDDFTDRSVSERHRDLAIKYQRQYEDDSPEMEQATLTEVA